MEKQAFKFPDEQGQEQEIELELETDEQEDQDESPDIEVIDDTPPQDRNRKPLDKEIEEPTEDELSEYSAKVQKRIKELTHARHDDRRKAEALERQRVELERVAKMMAEENKRLKEFASKGQTAYIDKSKSLAETNLTKAKAKLKQALEEGDTEGTIEAQEELYRAQFELQQVSNYRPIEFNQQPQETNLNTDQGSSPPQLDDKVVSWVERNPWFQKRGKERMTHYANGVHAELVNKFGEAYTQTDEYYLEIDKAMRQAFPEEFGITPEQEASPKASRKSVVAPSQRSTAPKKVRLTKTQLDVCRRYNITPEHYAKEMLKLEQNNG